MLRAVVSLHALRAFVMRAPDKNSRARANYLGAFLSILRAVAFCTRVFVKLKASGTVQNVLKILTVFIYGLKLSTKFHYDKINSTVFIVFILLA